MATIPYADTSYAFAYFSDRLATSAWDNAAVEDQIKALKQATRAIDRLTFAGDKHDLTLALDGTPNQPSQFPRGDDVTVPNDVKDACCELALALLDGVDPNLEIENQGITHQHIGGASMSRDTRIAQDHTLNGIPSIQAWLLLKPYMLDLGNGQISRA